LLLIRISEVANQALVLLGSCNFGFGNCFLAHFFCSFEKNISLVLCFTEIDRISLKNSRKSVDQEEAQPGRYNKNQDEVF
jgi:hypothetical protein